MRLGVLGGTFDPIHLGHLLLAEQAREQLSLDEVLMVPAGRPPHKPDRIMTAYPLRYRMCELALEGVAGIRPADLERESGRPSYTVDTLRRLRSDPDLEELWLLIGRDCLPELPTWREPREILRLASLAVYPRPLSPEVDASVDDVPAGTADLLEPAPAVEPEAARYGERIVFLEGPRLCLSSSEIRARVHGGRSIRFLVPEVVRRFIDEQGLYRGPEWDSPAEPRHG